MAVHTQEAKSLSRSEAVKAVLSNLKNQMHDSKGRADFSEYRQAKLDYQAFKNLVDWAFALRLQGGYGGMVVAEKTLHTACSDYGFPYNPRKKAEAA